jgi:uncharacterized repeat protein (TIGR01451 family)
MFVSFFYPAQLIIATLLVLKLQKCLVMKHQSSLHCNSLFLIIIVFFAPFGAEVLLGQCDNYNAEIIDIGDFPLDEDILDLRKTSRGIYFITENGESQISLFHYGVDGLFEVFETDTIGGTSIRLFFLDSLATGYVFAVTEGTSGTVQSLYVVEEYGTVNRLDINPPLNNFNGSSEWFKGVNGGIIILRPDSEAVMLIGGNGVLTEVAPPGEADYGFSDTNPTTGEIFFVKGEKLYITDGTVDGTVELADISIPFLFSLGLAFDGELAYYEDDDQLYVTNGTPGGTVLVETQQDFPNVMSNKLRMLNGKVLLTGRNDEGHSAVFAFDPQEDELVELFDSGGGSFYPGAVWEPYINDHRFFFNGLDENGQIVLWQTDGTLNGTEIAADNLVDNGIDPVVRSALTDGGYTYLEINKTDQFGFDVRCYHASLPPMGMPLGSGIGGLNVAEDAFAIGSTFFLYYRPDNELRKYNGLTGEYEVLLSGVEWLRWVTKDPSVSLLTYETSDGDFLSRLDMVNSEVEIISDIGYSNHPEINGFNLEADQYLLYDDSLKGLTIGLYDDDLVALEDEVDIFQNTQGFFSSRSPTFIKNHVLYWEYYLRVHSIADKRNYVFEEGPFNTAQVLGASNEAILLVNFQENLFYELNLEDYSISSFTPLNANGNPSSYEYVSNAINWQGELFFLFSHAYTAGSTLTKELVKWTANSDSLKVINSFSAGNLYSEITMAATENYLYFSWQDGEGNEELWRSDGTADDFSMFLEINSSFGDAEPDNFISLDSNDIVFSAKSPGYNSFLLRDDQELIDLSIAGFSNRIKEIVELEDYYLYRNTDELWRLDKSNNESTLLLDFSNGFQLEDNIAELKKINKDSAVFFWGVDEIFELWVTDGTPQQTGFLDSTYQPVENNDAKLAVWDGNAFYNRLNDAGDYVLMRYDFKNHFSEALDYLIVDENEHFVVSDTFFFLADDPVYGNDYHYLVCSTEVGRIPFHLAVYNDQNMNQQRDEGELPISNFPIALFIAENNLTFTSETGIFRYPFIRGEQYGLAFLLDDCWEMSDPNTNYLQITLDSTQTDTLQVGLISTGTPARSTPNLTSGPTRCSFTIPFWLNVRNTGCSAAEMFTSLRLPPEVMLISANQAYETGPDENEFTFQHGSLQPGQLAQVMLELQMPNENFIGQTIEILAISGAEGLVSDTFIYQSTLTCAYDPNDKLVLPARPEPSMSNYTQFDELLTYTVRFQNTGNDTAFTVRIEDRLSPRLDWSSVRPIAASHPYTVQVDEDGLLTALFENILLPDSSTNFVGSQGFVTIEVAMRDDIVDFSTIQNTAGIFFDFNAPIITNTVFNTAVEFLDFDQDGFFFWNECDDLDSLINPTAIEINGNGIDEDCDGIDGPNSLREINQPEATIYPNPTNGQSRIALNDWWPLSVPYRLLSPTGKQLQQGVVSGREGLLNVQLLPAGVYYLQLYHQQNGRWLPFTIVRF